MDGCEGFSAIVIVTGLGEGFFRGALKIGQLRRIFPWLRLLQRPCEGFSAGALKKDFAKDIFRKEDGRRNFRRRKEGAVSRCASIPETVSRDLGRVARLNHRANTTTRQLKITIIILPGQATHIPFATPLEGEDKKGKGPEVNRSFVVL